MLSPVTPGASTRLRHPTRRDATTAMTTQATTKRTDRGPKARALVTRPGPGQLRLRPTGRGHGFVVGFVDANGADTVGFANRDRVAWRDAGGQLPSLLILDQDEVLGVPDWISDRQVVELLGPGLIARALVRQSRPVGRGDAVRVESSDPVVAALTRAWLRSLGALVVEAGPAIVLAYEPQHRRSSGGHGKLAQGAVDVFQAIRAGAFDRLDGYRSDAA